MKIYLCTHCGSADLAVDITVNPNDQTTAQNMCADLDVDDTDVYCNSCGDYRQAGIVEPGHILPHETHQFALWQQGWQDMFVVGERNYRRSDRGMIGYKFDIIYSVTRAGEYIAHRIASSANEFHSCVLRRFDIFYFNPTVKARPEAYPDANSVTGLFNEHKITPILNPIYTEEI